MGKHGCVPNPLTVEIQGGAIWPPLVRNRGIETPVRNRVKEINFNQEYQA